MIAKNPFEDRVEVHRGYKFLEVRIDGLSHLLLDYDRLIGVQSWEEGQPATGFAIEFSLAGGDPVVSRYNIRSLWEVIVRKTSDCLQCRKPARRPQSAKH